MTTSMIRRFRFVRGGPGSGPQGGPSPKESKSDIAKKAHVLVDKTIQRYAEEHNEPEIAAALGGNSLKDNEPVDIVVKTDDGKTHGVELKTVVVGTNGKITMKGEALARKRSWARKNKADFHTLVVNDTAVFNAKGEGKHDTSKREILYRRGAGSFRLSKMYVCKDMAEVKTLMSTPTRKLPEGAK